MKRGWKIFGAIVGGAVVAVAGAVQLMRNHYEEPSYEVVAEHGELSVRRYAPRVVAQTTVTGTEAEVTSEGFRRLAGYIFGGNGGEQSIAMTSPVERGAAPSEDGDGTNIAMTTPVERSPGEGGWVVTFTMPNEHTLESLPTPNDPRVELRELPARTVAVLRFSGRVDVEEKERRVRQLRGLMAERGLEPAGEPTLAQYDPPWVFGPLRRNEVLVPVRDAS